MLGSIKIDAEELARLEREGERVLDDARQKAQQTVAKQRQQSSGMTAAQDEDC